MTRSEINNFIVEIVSNCLNANMTVCYIDKDRQRRGYIRGITEDYNKLEVTNGALSGYGRLHTNVLFVVNPHEFEEQELKEAKNIPAYLRGIGPMYIELRVDNGL